MNKPVMRRILDKIREYDRIVITRHFRPDGDAVGSSKGLQRILQLTYPEKEIYVINRDYSDYMAFLGGEDAQFDDALYADALIIVTDTATADRISNKKYSLGREIIKIDHHIETNPYGNISWVEEDKSSACELITEFYIAFSDELKIDREAATYLYTGMITDSGRFKIRDVNGDTLRNAAVLLDIGVDTESLFAHLYLDDFDYLKFKSDIIRKMKMTENGVAYLYISRAVQEKYGLTFEQASATVSFLDSIKGSIIWLAFIEHADDNGEFSIRVRLRSRFVTVNELASRYRGGGHACASGATLYNKKEVRALLDDADRVISEYKTNNEGWL